MYKSFSNSTNLKNEKITIIVLSYFTDLSVGLIKKEDLSPEYSKIGLSMFVERFRRGLRLHKEFSQKLSDFERSALWRNNYKYATGIALCKVSFRIKDKRGGKL